MKYGAGSFRCRHDGAEEEESGLGAGMMGQRRERVDVLEDPVPLGVEVDILRYRLTFVVQLDMVPKEVWPT